VLQAGDGRQKSGFSAVDLAEHEVDRAGAGAKRPRPGNAGSPYRESLSRAAVMLQFVTLFPQLILK
jgi:hypothetical protein